jgi:cytochrome P450
MSLAPDALAAAPRADLTAAAIRDGRAADLVAAVADRGSSVVRVDIPVGPDAGPCLCLLGAQAAEMALGAQRDAFSSDLGWRPILGQGFGQAVLNVDEPLHTQQRRLIAPAFAAEFIERYAERIIAYADATFRPWCDGDIVDTYRAMCHFTFRVVGATVIGLAEAIIEPAYHASRVFLDGYDFETESRAEFLARTTIARENLLSLLRAAVHERRRGPASEARSVLDLLLAPATAGGTQLGDEAIAGYLAILLIAGHDTGATMYGRALYCLAVMPDVADALAAELAAAGWTAARPLGVADLDRLRLLESFMLEVGRLYPPLINLPRVMARDLEFAGYRLTKGTRVAIAIAASQRLAALHRHPARFDLSRYDDPGADRKTRPFLMLTFAGGGRMCLGMRFAQIEFKAIIARVVSTLQLSPCASEAIAHAGFWVARPAAPLRVRAAAR